MFVIVIPETLIDEIPLLVFLPFILIPPSTRILISFNFLVTVFLNYFLNEPFHEFANDIIPLIGSIGESNILGCGPRRSPLTFTI